MPATGILAPTANVAASVIKPAPVTPDALLLTSASPPQAGSSSSWPSVRSIFSACAMNSEAIVI